MNFYYNFGFSKLLGSFDLMVSRVLLLTVFQLFVAGVSIGLENQNPYAYLLEIRSEKGVIEALLRTPLNFNGDTLRARAALDPMLELGRQKKDPKICWAYYVLMADMYSVAFDAANEKTNESYALSVKEARKAKAPELEMLSNLRQGYYYFIYRQMKDAFPYFLRANEFKDKLQAADVPLAAEHYSYMANFYSYIGDHKTAISYLRLGIPYSEKYSRRRIDMLNSTGIYLGRDSMFKGSEIYFREAMKTAVVAKDSVWIGIISGNLANFEMERGNIDTAMSLIYRNIYYSQRFHEYHDAMRAYIKLAKIYVSKQQYTPAKEALYRAEGYVQDKPYYILYKRDIAKCFADIAHGENNPLKELVHLQELTALNDSLNRRLNDDMMQKIYWRRESERHHEKVLAAEFSEENQRQFYQMLAALLASFFVIALLLVNRKRGKEKMRAAILEKEQLKLKIEKNALGEELTSLQVSMQDFTTTIRNNDQTIHKLRQELAQGSRTLAPEQMERINEDLSQMLQSHIMTDERWLKFKNVFDLLYPDYLSNYKLQNPRLSENDMRLLAFMKLDLGNHSISDLLGVSIDAVKKAKQRLKKKMETVDAQ